MEPGEEPEQQYKSGVWCSGLAHQTFNLKLAGSNPVTPLQALGEVW